MHYREEWVWHTTRIQVETIKRQKHRHYGASCKRLVFKSPKLLVSVMATIAAEGFEKEDSLKVDVLQRRILTVSL